MRKHCSTLKKVSNTSIRSWNYPPPSDIDQLTAKYVDKLVKVYYRSGTEAWLVVHIEEGYRDESFAGRMFTYYCRIWDK